MFFTGGVEFHAAHHVGVEERADEEGEEGGSGNAGGQSEHGMESVFPMPVWGTGKGIGNQTEEDKKKVHEEAEPDDETGTLVAPDFDHAVIDDVGNGKHDEPRREVKRTYDDLLGFKKVGCNEANTEKHSEQHERNAYRRTVPTGHGRG